MTVEDLISRLAAFDPQFLVIMPGESQDFCVVGDAYIDTVKFDECGIPSLSDARNGTCTKVVRLFRDEGD